MKASKSIKTSAAALAAVMAVSLLFALNCDNEPDNTNNSETNIGSIDTLCAYWGYGGKYYDGNYVFQNETQLTAFLDSSRYAEDDRDTYKKRAHLPDFKKWSYVAYAGPNWGYTVDVSYGEDTVTVYYCITPNTVPPCTACANTAPAPVIIVYFIPYTDKPIQFKHITRHESGEADTAQYDHDRPKEI